MGVDRVLREGTSDPKKVNLLSISYVSLRDFNQDGLPDIVIAGDEGTPFGFFAENLQSDAAGNPVTTPTVWHVFLNTGTGFETQQSLDVTSPFLDRSDLQATGIHPIGLSVPYPTIQRTRSVGTVVGSQSRDISETAAGMIDIDGDGVAEVARRVHILPGTTGGAQREGLLIWKRASTGPQDTMIDDRYPLEGRQYLIEYRPASAFQWNDAKPTGVAPQAGHQLLAGTAPFLVRSVKTERLQGRAEQRTMVGYDYKRPFFDLSTRTSTGFAERTTTPLDPATGAPLPASLAEARRSSQRPNDVPTTTHVRRFIVANGAPVSETLTSYAESAPTATGGAGGLDAVYSAATRTFTVDYPSDLSKAAVLDLGFDGREPFRDWVSGAGPLSQGGAQPRPAAPTGGAAAFDGTRADVLTYSSPHPQTPLDEITIEAWLKPEPGSGDRVVAQQQGAYRLLIASVGGQDRWRLEVSGSPAVTSSEPVVANRWQYVVAAAGQGGAHIFVNGRDVGAGTGVPPSVPSGALFVGCGAGTAVDCFAGDLGELRIHPEAWDIPPRVTDSEARTQLSDQTRADFGMTLRELERHDMARNDDDLATEYEYARPSSAAGPRVLGLVATEAKRVLLADGETSGNYLEFTRHEYDGLAAGLVSHGNETSTARFDGPSEVTQPPQPLRVRTLRSYDPACPGLVKTVTDPAGFETTTAWDASCTFPLQTRNALGHVVETHYYGVNPISATSISGPTATYSLHGHYGQVEQSVDSNGAATTSTYDEWGRTSAVWKPLARSDRPSQRFFYLDASCRFTGAGQLAGREVSCEAAQSDLVAPPLVTTMTWDDQLRRCEDGAHRLVACSSPASRSFADESSTGAYRVSYAFGDGQVQKEAVAKHPPAWSVNGIVDYDRLGRAVRTYRVQYLPSGCPEAGTWCDPATAGDPLRKDTAMVQTAYDPRGRVAKVYGPTIARCPEDAVGDPNCSVQPGQTPPVDVTAVRYLAPGVVETTDAKGVPTVVHTDSRGLTTAVDEFLAPSTPVYSRLVTTYDRLGRAETVTDQNGNTSHNRYDALSRLSGNDDPDRGTTTYRYDVRSNLTEQLVATGEKTVHTYDPLSRITQTDYLRPKPGPTHPVCCKHGDEPPPPSGRHTSPATRST
jgi:YD repeat-containing protein